VVDILFYFMSTDPGRHPPDFFVSANLRLSVYLYSIDALNER
jgi:hypothetical protein